jgi:hypothetical protein
VFNGGYGISSDRAIAIEWKKILDGVAKRWYRNIYLLAGRIFLLICSGSLCQSVLYGMLPGHINDYLDSILYKNVRIWIIKLK